jgi:uncharacterized Zn finger protein
MPTNQLTDSFSRRSLALLADPGSLARGRVYASDGRVEQLKVSGARATAVVRGTMPYAVELWVGSSGETGWSCTCPVAEDGRFCKHAVAVALTATETASPSAAVSDGDRRAERTASREPAELRAYVAGLDSERLVDLVVEAASGDWRLRERFLAQAAAATGAGLDITAWRRRLDDAFSVGDFEDGYVRYQEAEGWAEDVRDALDGLEELLDGGWTDAVAELSEHAHRLAERSIGSVDDSDGCLVDIAERIGDLHLRACAGSGPDPVALARRLVDLELTSELDTFHRAAATYAQILGETGIAEYRRLVAPRFNRLRSDDPSNTNTFRVRSARIGVALASGDPDELIAVKTADLRTPDDYREVAEMLATTGRTDEALDWAKRGIAAFPTREWQARPLREFLARRYRQQGQDDEAAGVFWDGFQADASLETYRRLLTEAGEVDQPDHWREAALDHLRSCLRSAPNPEVASPAIDVFLYEGLTEEAWEIATRHGASSRWLALARAREATHPGDAVPVYVREIAAQIDLKKNDGYRRAVALIDRVRVLHDRLGQPDAFARYLAEIRANHGRKRNLMALIDRDAGRRRKES